VPDTDLLFKLLFINEPLSIQVHPGDVFARSIGLPRGKTEAWYILSASPAAKVALGLKRRLTATQLRNAIEDGSIADLVRWRHVQKDDVILVPAGTIHAIGAGIVVVEIQQNSDATFRLFDFGRGRELHVDNALSVAHAGPAPRQAVARRLTDARALLAATLYFVLERIDLDPGSNWELDAAGETWLVALRGEASVGSMRGGPGEAFFLEDDRIILTAGADGFSALVAYGGPEPRAGLLHSLARLPAGELSPTVEARP